MQDTSLEDASIAERLSQSARFRRTMVDCQIRTFDVTDQLLLARMLDVPREHFLPPELAPLAYSDTGLQMNRGGERRTLLPPLVLARLIQGASVESTDTVLDVGAATGYSSTLLAGLAGRVVALESERSLYNELRSNLDSFGLTKVQTVLAPLPEGAPKEAPFDVIFINGAVEANLDALFAQLKDGGRLVALKPLSGDLTGRASKAVRYEKIDGGTGYRVLFDAPAPVLDAFRRDEQFTFF
ncbi:MAG: Protein-L-isoaspartate O-methyltransferase [Beijerinckiaceae bacterium]|jgi:protein-L-isoaspartate(D-aspartate) O-methyltransferase|nr:MAG: Protein-L-isoaspartate O-methyltransferase [Beijerinckiaceae bacterium]